jgi:phosphoribosylanthranilate isomerase
MSLKIKVCGMCQKDIVDKVYDLNIDYIGFINIERSKRFVDLETISDLTENINNKDYSTLILDDVDYRKILDKVDNTGINRVQFHSDIDENTIGKLHSIKNEIYVIKVIGIKNQISENIENDLKSFAKSADGILFDYVKDGLTGGTNTHIPVDTAIKAARITKKSNPNCDVILAGGLNYEYLKSIHENLKYFDVIDINSGVEDEPGVKNIDKIEKIVDLIKK